MKFHCRCGWEGEDSQLADIDMGALRARCPKCRADFQLAPPPRPSTKAAIAAEIYKALERLNAPPELLSIIGSWEGGELKDIEVLSALKDWNDFGVEAQQIIAE